MDRLVTEALAFSLQPVVGFTKISPAFSFYMCKKENKIERDDCRVKRYYIYHNMRKSDS